MNNYLSILKQVEAEQEKYGEKFQPPATDADILHLIDDAKKSLSADIPKEYVDFLKITNGLISENLNIYASQRILLVGYSDTYIDGFVEMNLIARDVEESKDLLIFGSSGNIDLYVQKLSTQEYEILDYTSLSLTKQVSSFDELMVEALKTCLSS
jgi:SMI1-KNR4 cell-wall